MSTYKPSVKKIMQKKQLQQEALLQQQQQQIQIEYQKIKIQEERVSEAAKQLKADILSFANLRKEQEGLHGSQLLYLEQQQTSIRKEQDYIEREKQQIKKIKDFLASERKKIASEKDFQSKQKLNIDKAIRENLKLSEDIEKKEKELLSKEEELENLSITLMEKQMETKQTESVDSEGTGLEDMVIKELYLNRKDKGVLDSFQEKIVSRKLLVFMVATILLTIAELDPSTWGLIAMCYIGGQSAIDMVKAWRGV